MNFLYLSRFRQFIAIIIAIFRYLQNYVPSWLRPLITKIGSEFDYWFFNRLNPKSNLRHWEGTEYELDEKCQYPN